MPEPTPAIELRELTKAFGSCIANSGINLRVNAGTIHALVGENGAGKSTAMKLLYGIYQPDSGEMVVNGQERRWSSPADAIAAGIGMVHQHFMLAGPYSALDNILLGAEPLRSGLIDRNMALKKLDALATQYGLPVDWHRPVEDLPVGIQQRIEILKLLYRRANILILDEPTAVLTPQETNALFENLKKLRSQGKTILLVTHKLKEVMAFTDRVTVFRSGKVVNDLKTSETNPQELADLMVGRKVTLRMTAEAMAVGASTITTGTTQQPERARSRPLHGSTDVPAIEITGLTIQTGRRPKLSNLTFSVGFGEIIGIAGVEGNGQSELLQALLHPRRDEFHESLGSKTSGTIRFLGHDVSHCSAAQVRDLGVAFIPEDRQREGLLLERSVRDNFLLGMQRESSFRRWGFLNSQKITLAAKRAVQEHDVRPADLSLSAGKLSGGNQQKLILAREFHRQPRILIAAQPTRGVDVGAIEFIHDQILRARDAGAAVLLVSSELDEIFALSDRILVMFEGQIVAEFPRGKVSDKELGLKMGGA